MIVLRSRWAGRSLSRKKKFNKLTMTAIVLATVVAGAAADEAPPKFPVQYAQNFKPFGSCEFSLPPFQQRPHFSSVAGDLAHCI